MEEKDLFPIIEKRLTELGFIVKAEVNHVDVMAIKEDKTLIIEMKNTLTLSLIYQGIERQKLTDSVYLAVLKPSDKTLKSRTFREKKAIIKRLGLGLILVDTKNESLSYILDANANTFRKDSKKRKKLHQEFNLRQNALNQGGVTKTKIITAYRELALRILDYLKDGEQPLKDIVAHTKEMKATRVLNDNHYGWFKRVSRGIYALSD